MSVDTVAPDTRHESVGMLLSNMTNNKNENAYYFIRLIKTNLLVVLYVGKIYSGNKTGGVLSGV